MREATRRKAVYRFQQVPAEIAETKARAILCILAESLKEQRRAAPAAHENTALESLYQTTEV